MPCVGWGTIVTSEDTEDLMHWIVSLAAAPAAKQAAATFGWNWSVFLAAIAGGLIGAGIPALMTMAGWRRERARRREERQWADAEIIADARQFLLDVDPVRRGLNANPSPGAEDAQWASLNQRRDQVRRRLLVLAAGHASATVRSSAEKLEPQLFTAAVQAEWHVADVIKNRDNPEHLGYARECHENAVATCAELERVVKAGQGK
jgi:hypothetical protein